MLLILKINIMEAYFNLLHEVFDEFDFDNRPQCIFNMDEKGVPFEPRPPKVIARKGQKKIRYRTSGQKAQTTVIGCGNAVGNILPPFIIFAAKQLNPGMIRREKGGGGGGGE